MLPNDGWLCLSIRCRSCFHRALADLRAIIEAGRGDRRFCLKSHRLRTKRRRRFSTIIIKCMGLQQLPNADKALH
jgi:hypothetical protein